MKKKLKPWNKTRTSRRKQRKQRNHPRKAKKNKRDKIEVLKLLSDHPEIVEVHDVNSPYPWLLVDLKSYRNTVPVPRHWSQRRKYLQGKRGVEKPPFELPEFIRNTGICDIRQAVLEKEDSQKLKQQARDRLQPKTGKIDIDYHVLYDAFFRNQTKPRLTGHSELYYEGKEYEVDLKERKPGHLSKKLRLALGMPEEGVYPPPWLVNMQRNGAPPSYPHLRLPGITAPIPPGAKVGFQPGGWGQPPVESFGRSMYSDANGESAGPFAEPVEANTWGVLEQDESDDEFETMEQDEQMYEEEEPEDTPMTTDIEPSEVQSGTASVGGYETPESIDLRKQKLLKAPVVSDGPKQLYQELKQVDAPVGNATFGSQHRYVMPGKEERVVMMKGQKSEKMEVSLDPNELDAEEGITEDLIRKKYDDSLQLEKAAHRKEDLSDLVASDSAKRKRKAKDKKKEFRF